jgi:hypothetical protein
MNGKARVGIMWNPVSWVIAGIVLALLCLCGACL